MATKIGFCGLGSMGSGMAANLRNHLVATNAGNLHYSNRTLAKGDAIKAAGGIPEKSFAALVRTGF